MFGSSLAFLSWDRFAAAMENRQAFADGLGTDGLTVDSRRMTGGFFETQGPDPFRRSLADLVVAPGREEAASSSDRVVGGEEVGRSGFQEDVAWDWVGGPLANEWDMARVPARARLGETEAADRAFSHGGDEAAPAFAERATAGEVSPPAPYGNAAHAAYSSSAMDAFDASAFYGNSQPAQVQSLSPAANVSLPPVPAQPVAAQPESKPAVTLPTQQPLIFEPNQGQTDAQVKFVAQAPGYNLFLTAAEAVMVLRRTASAPGSGVVSAPDDSSRVGHKREAQPVAAALDSAVVRMRLEGAASAPSVVAEEQQPGVRNYFIGNDPHKWATDVPRYGRVQYHNIYPGVDWVFHGSTNRQLEYDFVVAPGANPGVIRLSFQGATGARVDADGSLHVSTAVGELLEHAPVIYQPIGDTKQAVSGRYVLHGPEQIGFEVNGYDTDRPLVIDPVASYSTYLGGSGGDDHGNAIAVDAAGNAYVTGQTDSVNFPTANPLFGYGGGFDAFVTKLDATGTELIYSTYLGGGGDDYGNGIAVDASGNAYVTGSTTSTNFPTTLGAYQTMSAGLSDAFVTKINASGNSLVYSTYLGGSLRDQANGIAVNAAGVPLPEMIVTPIP